MRQYHDEEWGVPCHDDSKLFEYILLDTFQAGLSWKTILNKRENFRVAFSNFKPETISNYAGKEIKRLMSDKGIIRNRLKILGAIENAKKFIDLKKEFGSFAKYIWQFTNYRIINNEIKSVKEIKTISKESDTMSNDLKKRGFKFVGSTTCYAFMQAIGMVNDHEINCFRYKELR